jgi:hypothetical protein
VNPDPRERPQTSVPDDDIDADVPDDDDTGPLHVTAAPSPPDSDWEPVPPEGTWAGRFDAPLTVSPRQVRTPRNPNILLGAVGAVVAVALVGGLVFWLTRPSSDRADGPSVEPSTSAAPATPTSNDEDEAKLKRLLPRGYSPDSCEVVAPPKNSLAQVNCARNTDPDGPLSATYTLASDKAALDAVFTNTMQAAERVNCPGNIQSPGPWRRNATPETVSGMLFCGLRKGQPTVVWTDDARLVLYAVQSGPQGPTFPALYAWWSSHS